MARPTLHYPSVRQQCCDVREASTLDALVSLGPALCTATTTVHCSVTLTVPGRPPETVAATSDLPIRADWLQDQLRQGPDLALCSSEVVVSKDLARDPRWPDFGRMCVAVLGLYSLVTIAVPLGTVRASVKFYSDQPTALDLLDIDAARRLAGHAARMLDRRDGTKAQASALSAAHPGCSKLVLALCVVMARQRLDSREAFLELQKSATAERRTLYEQATLLVESLDSNGSATRNAQRFSRHDVAGETDRGDLRTVGGPEMWRDPHAHDAAQPARDFPRRVAPHRGRARRTLSGSAAAG